MHPGHVSDGPRSKTWCSRKSEGPDEGSDVGPDSVYAVAVAAGSDSYAWNICISDGSSYVGISYAKGAVCS